MLSQHATWRSSCTSFHVLKMKILLVRKFKNAVDRAEIKITDAFHVFRFIQPIGLFNFFRIFSIWFLPPPIQSFSVSISFRLWIFSRTCSLQVGYNRGRDLYYRRILWRRRRNNRSDRWRLREQFEMRFYFDELLFLVNTGVELHQSLQHEQGGACIVLGRATERRVLLIGRLIQQRL